MATGQADQIKSILNSVPYSAVAVGVAAWFGYGYYHFTHDPSSPLQEAEAAVQAAQAEVANLESKARDADEFYRTLDVKREVIRTLATQLNEMKVTISGETDAPSFIRTLVTEARKVGLNVLSVKPLTERKRQYYIEDVFELEMKGVFVQFLVFLERISNIQKITRIDDYELRPEGAKTNQYVELKAKVAVKTFRYLGSEADQIAGRAQAGGRDDPNPVVPANAKPASRPAAGQSGGK